MENITTNEFKKTIADIDQKDLNFKIRENTILMFSAPWCGPCRMLSPILEDLQKEYSFNLYKIDTDEEYELSKFFNIRSIPTILFVPLDGKPISHTGAFPKSEIKKFIEKYFGK